MTTSFSRRLKAVLWTYTSRWSAWVVALVAGILLAAGWMMSLDHNSHIPDRLTTVAPRGTTVGARHYDVSNDLLKNREDVRDLTIMSHQKLPAGTLKQLPKLRCLALYSITDSSLWDEVAELSELESLTIVGDLPEHPRWLGFGQLAKVSYVSWNAAHSAKRLHLEQLAEMPQLETLDLTGAWPHRDMDWSVLRKFRSVRTLVLGMGPDWFKPNVVTELRAMPKLHWLYVWNSANRVDPFAGYETLRRELPHLEIRPGEVNAKRSQPMFPTIFGAGIAVLMAALFHWTTQFASPISRLIPGYVGPHLFVVVVIWLIAVGSVWGVTYRAGSPWWTSLSIAFLPPALAGLLLFSIQHPTAQRTLANKMMATLTGIVFPLCCFVPFLIALNQGLFDWYLRGEMPVVAAIVGFSSLGVNCLAVQRLIHLHPVMQEMGLNYNPYQMDFNRAFSTQAMSVNAEGAVSKWQSVWWSFQARRLERRVRDRRAVGWLSNATRWIRGNPICGADTVWMLPSVLVFFGVLFTLFFTLIGRRLPGDPLPIMVPMLTMGLIGFALPMAIQWYAKQSLLGYESLRPVTRSQFTREVWTAILLDQVPPALLQSLLLGLFGLWQHAPLGQIVVAMVSSLLPWVFLAGWVLIALSMRRTWRLFLVGVAAYVTTLAPLGLPIALLQQTATIDVILWMFGFGLVAAALFAIACYRWQRLEFGALQ